MRRTTDEHPDLMQRLADSLSPRSSDQAKRDVQPARQTLPELIHGSGPHEIAVYDRQRDVQGLEDELRDARDERDQAVRDADSAGVVRARIRELTGLSSSRISQIIHGRR